MLFLCKKVRVRFLFALKYIFKRFFLPVRERTFGQAIFYNKDGSMNKRIDTYPVILDIVNDYLLIVQNENIYLIDLNDKITDLHIKLRLKDRFKYMSIDGELVIITLLDDYVTSYQVFSYCLSHQDECYYETEDKIKNCSLGYRHIYNIRNGSIKTMPYALCGEQ